MEPGETAWDLRWQMFGIPVRVHPMFWLVTAIMGSSALRMGAQYLLIWIACVFVSILIHELGHVTMGRLFGAHGHIVLYGFGGLAIGSSQLDSRLRRIAVYFAGPLAGFLFLGAILGFLWLRDPELFPVYLNLVKLNLGIPLEMDEGFGILMAQVILQHRVQYFVVGDLIFINLLWGLVNLLPVWPLDGGQISRDVCTGISPDRGMEFSLGISLVAAGLLAVHCVMALNGRPFLPINLGGSIYSALFFGLLALQSFQLMQQVHAERRWADDHWEHEER
jgi:Zn-dependent protease